MCMQLYIKAVMCQCAHCMKTKHRAVCIAACVTTTLVPVYMDPHNNILSLACLSLHACMHVNAAVHKSGYVSMCMQPSDCAEKSLHGNARVHHFRKGSTRTPALDSGYHTAFGRPGCAMIFLNRTGGRGQSNALLSILRYPDLTHAEIGRDYTRFARTGLRPA